MASLAGVIAGCCLPSMASAATQTRSKLSLPPSAIQSDYDVVVVGSGYGGAVMAARLAPGRKLCVLERGREWQPSDFPSQLDQAIGEFRGSTKPLGLFDYHAGPHVDVLVGNGLGGTSLINANVVMPPDRDIFSGWPAAIRNDYASGVMAGYEKRVLDMLAVEAVGQADGLRKNWFHVSTSEQRKKAGSRGKTGNLPLSVNLSRYASAPNAQGVVQALCKRCGDCVTGCRYGAKNSLDVNYLPLARQRGAEIISRTEVSHVERLANGQWRVHYVARPEGAAAYSGALTARAVVLSAGTLGTTKILMRSRAQGLPLSDALGKRFSANGDILGLAYNTDVQTNIMGFGTGLPAMGLQKVGPTITTVSDYRGAAAVSERFLIEDGAVPSLLVDAMRTGLPPLAGISTSIPEDQRMAKDLAGKDARGALNHSMIYLGIGHDSAGGRLELAANGSVSVNWPGITDEPFVSRIRAEMTRHANAFEGTYLDSPRSHPIFGGAMTTVHPLGGSPMSDRSDSGVVNANGQVYDPRTGLTGVHSGLYAVDGSIVPGSIGVNPLLTIAALAERAADRFS
ncbi:GMC family oxidoreductase N-terminal domain-containing protein [Agrilutibacter solisilvae]|uniref:Cholesterol oxidase n=1 Tax=Agrilutibacter solisilvae TaxID=2763317 RepID=A0A974XZ03_9GAMM|nr:GMC family oxidoreductase N-terminal domain-containing protein [Lysobacter solisilvae]QSX77493.1 GMC family oxidoreductase [Lysobacter solisilvae]